MKKPIFSQVCFVLILTLFSGFTLKAQTIPGFLIPDSSNAYTVINNPYMPDCAQMTGVSQGHELTAFRAAVKGEATSHFTAMYCMFFGLNPSGNSRMALVLSPNPDLTNLPGNYTQPNSSLLTFEFENADSADYLHVWNFKSGVKQSMDTVFLGNLTADLANGETYDVMIDYHAPDPNWPGDPNAYRLKLIFDGITVYDTLYNFPDSLFAGKLDFHYWVVAQSDPLNGNVQTACIHSWDCTAPLATTFEMFEAKGRNDITELDWQIATDGVMDFFEIERSKDGVMFEPIGRVGATGGERFSYQDREPFEGTNYYRIQAADRNGSQTTSEVQSVWFVSGGRVEVYPTVLEDGWLTISADEAAHVSIYDLNGRELKGLMVVKGEQSLDLTGWSAGMYLVVVEQKQQRNVTRIVIR